MSLQPIDNTAGLTPERFAAILQREAAATPGPWAYDAVGAEVVHAPTGHIIADVWDEDGTAGAFIAAAREDVPVLLAEVERLNAERDTYRAQILAEAKTETVDWLVKKAREYRSTGSRQHTLQADVIEVLASKVDRGAVRAFLGTAHYRDALDIHRTEVLNEAANWLASIGQEDAAHMLRTCDVPQGGAR